MFKVPHDFVYLVCKIGKGERARHVKVHVKGVDGWAAIPRTISLILGVPLRDGSLLVGLLEWADIPGNRLDWLERVEGKWRARQWQLRTYVNA